MNRIRISAVVLLLSFAGCESATVKTQVRDNAASSSADERDYKAGKLTADQVSQSIHDSAKAWATLNYSVNGVPIPAPYADPSPAPASSIK